MPWVVGALDELAQAEDDVGGADDVVALGGVRVGGVANVVDALHNDEVLHSGLAEHVAVEAGECAGAGVIVQDAIAANSLIDDAQVRGLLVGLQAVCKYVRPAGVGVARTGCTVGNAVAEGYDSGAVCAGFDVDAFEDGPGGDGLRSIELFGSRDVAGCE